MARSEVVTGTDTSLSVWQVNLESSVHPSTHPPIHSDLLMVSADAEVSHSLFPPTKAQLC